MLTFFLLTEACGGVEFKDMKKYTLFFVFVLMGFNFNTTSAANCAPGDLFSSVTGQLCSTDNSISGAVGPLTRNQFHSLFDSSFKIGSRGQAVKDLQQLLKDEGYYFGRVDGRYGRITARAAKDFMEDNDVVATTSFYKTYTNTKYGFKFKLPSDFELAKQEEKFGQYVSTYERKSSANSAGGYFSIQIESLTNMRERAQTLTGNDYSKQPLTLENAIIENRSYNVYLDRTRTNRVNSTTINNIPAVTEEEVSVDDNGVSVAVVTYLLKNNNFIAISTPLAVDSSLRGQILSSFKFTK